MTMSERIGEMATVAAARPGKSVSLRTTASRRPAHARQAALGVALPGSGRHADHGANSGEALVWIEWLRPEGHDDDALSDSSTVLRPTSGLAVVTRYYRADELDAIDNQAREIGLAF